jgi:hypothetical protein
MSFECLLYLLDNTFFGTFLAGILLALIGLRIYRKQKEIDRAYEDRRKIREAASLLFAQLTIAAKKYSGLMNIHGEQNPELKLISRVINDRFNGQPERELNRELNGLHLKINDSVDELIALLKMENAHQDLVKLLSEKMPYVSLYLLTSVTLKVSDSQQIMKYRKAFFDDTLEPVLTALQAIISAKNGK